MVKGQADLVKSQREAVIEVMESNGGYATLQKLYTDVFKIEGVRWDGTKDFSANIRCLLQRRKKDFFKVKPGLWALESYRNKLPRGVQALIDDDKDENSFKTDSSHYYYQGQIVDIGNMHEYITYIPSQDKNRLYLEKTLKDVATTVELPEFTYKEIIDQVKSIDVIWLNKRKFPVNLFEIENTTKFKDALIKFYELKEFTTNMTIVSSRKYKDKFEEVINYSIFQEIKKRVCFWDYDRVEQYCGGLRQANKARL